MTIADAPYIREAEMYGWGPEDDGLDDAIDYLEDAVNELQAALTSIEDANYELFRNGEDESLVDTESLENAIDEIRKIIGKYKL